MNIFHVSTLLGVAAFILHIAAHQAHPRTIVSVWPPGPKFLLVLPSPSLTLTPNSRQIFTGESFTVQCPASQTDSISWSLKHFSVNLTEMCSSPQGAVCGNKCERCVFRAASENSGLYWCQSTEGRSSAISITVSDGSIILKTPALPVFKGDNVNLSCQYRTDVCHEAIFFKNGAKFFNSSGSDKVVNVTIYNVTQKDEGFYKCASPDRRMESPESWLSVIGDRGMFTSTVTPTTSTNESWKWIVVSCSIVLLFLIPLIVWLVRRIRHHTFSTQSCWPPSKEDVPAVPLPETKQDVTEVQWDLSWMEMSSLLDKQLYPST
ncbi:uncharacterized protein LOC121652556 isoform X2 [Melanotaenia boesemani]|uniref:uncharacterized protein LOC121652556 isoform X2 n=1 Tax=Melanotaenia boesemani TaxID=1250792 RepID=UPI001C057584|nr:uncharacterized protein LOC121652556 isoform X2 [Melanotaenia boesemani]